MFSKISIIIGYFNVAWDILKEVQNLVKLIEEDDIDNGVKNGKEKKNAVIKLITVVFDNTNKYIDLPFERDFVINLADNAIDVFVDIYNVIGRFRSKSTPTME